MVKRPTKAPATVERFRIHAEVSKDMPMSLLAELTKLGLQNIGYELITDIVTFRKNGPRKKALAPPAPKGKRPARNYAISNKDVILKRIKGRAKFTMIELQDHFRNIKRNPKSASAIIAHLFRDKMITRIDVGTYAWGNVKKKKVPKKIAVRKKRGASASQLEETNG